jgi:hypothetical protein
MFFGKKRYEDFDPSVETMRSKDSFNVYPVKRKWLKKKLKDRSVKEQVVEPSFINPYFSTSYNQMFYLCDFAEFATAKEESKRPLSLKDNLFGTTSSGKALRAGALASLVVGGGLAVKNRAKIKQFLDKPLETLKKTYTRDADGVERTAIQRKKKIVDNPEYNPAKPFRNKDGDLITEKEYQAGGYKGKSVPAKIEVYDDAWHDVRRTEKPERSFLGTGKKVNWGNVGKTVGVAGGLGAVPLTTSYVFADKNDREKINNRAGKVYGVTRGTMQDLRSWVNTLHRVSR